MSSVASTSSSQSSRSGDTLLVTSRASNGKGRSSPVVGIKGPSSRPVVGIKGLRSNAKSNDFSEGKLLSGDIVEQVVSSDGLELNSPFAGGKSGLQRELRRLYTTGQTLLVIKVKRGGGKVSTIKASIVPDDSTMLRKQYVLKASNEPSHVVMFTDSTEEECLALQEMRCARMVSQLVKPQLTDVNIPYSWEGKMKQVQPVRSSSMVFSMLVVPYARECASMPQYSNLEDTVAQAMVWLSASQASGVPINFLSIQTEPLLTKVSGQKSSSRTVSSASKGDLSSIVNTSIYGFEDYHGIDIGIVRAVRVWYVPNFAEVAIELKVEGDETRLGVGISRTEEGFCYVSNVEVGTAADRAGFRDLLTAAQASRKLLVVTRVADEKATPWLVSSNGSIRCFDTGSISRKLSAQRQAGQPARLHVMALEDTMHTMVYEKSEPMATLSSESERGFSDFFGQGHFQRE